MWVLLTAAAALAFMLIAAAMLSSRISRQEERYDQDEVADHLRRVLGYGESVTVLDSQRAVRIVERMGNRTELLYSEVTQ